MHSCSRNIYFFDIVLGWSNGDVVEVKFLVIALPHIHIHISIMIYSDGRLVQTPVIIPIIVNVINKTPMRLE